MHMHSTCQQHMQGKGSPFPPMEMLAPRQPQQEDPTTVSSPDLEAALCRQTDSKPHPTPGGSRVALAERCCHSMEDATYHQHFQDKMILVGRLQSVILYNIKGERRHLSDKRQRWCCHWVNQWDCARQRHPAPELKSLDISAVSHSHPLLPTMPTRQHSPPLQ